MIWITLVIFFMYRSISLKKELRILQLQHYQLSRYQKHMVTAYQESKQIAQSLILHLPFILLLFSESKPLELFSLLLLVYFYVVFKMIQSEEYKVKLHYTKRILRMYVMLFVLYAILFLCCYQHQHFLWIAIACMCFNKFFVYVACVCMYPIEKMIQWFYVQDARRVLKDNESLVKVGVVGSYGKTSTKNIIHTLLSSKYYALKSKSSFNNMMGNTLTIRKELKHVHEVFVAEMGSDHVGELRKLMRFIEPQYLIITSIGNQHLETFITQENIIKEKTSPLLCMKEEDIAFLNIDNPYIYANKEKGICKKVYFGEHVEAHYRVHDIKMDEHGSRFFLSHNGIIYQFETTLLGYFNIMNIVASIALAHTLHVPFSDIKQQVALLKPVEHRLQSIAKDNYTLIDNAYNSNEVSFQNSLAILKGMQRYKVFITPGLIDLKEDATINEKMMDYIEGSVDEIVVVGYKNRAALLKGLKRNGFESYTLVDTMEEALLYADSLPKENYVVFIENDIDKDFMNARK